jgi:diaminopimelate epimerase
VNQWQKIYLYLSQNVRTFVITKITMQLQFYKYQGTGNDFVMIDNRSDFFPKENVLLIEKLCD